MRARLVVALAAAAALAALPALPAAAGAQQVAARFEVTSVGDSTFTFPVGTQRWVPVRGVGIVVDPSRRDALVARFRVLRVQDGQATALVTAQTTIVTRQHFAVMTPPEPPRWWARGSFWGGAVAGAVVGAAVGLLL